MARASAASASKRRISSCSSEGFGGRHDDTAALGGQDQETFWVRPENILWRLVLNNHLPRDEPPRADEAFSVCCKQWPGDREKNCFCSGENPGNLCGLPAAFIAAPLGCVAGVWLYRRSGRRS